jgi:hypothetical protein
MDDEISYHSSRALAELDCARRCADVQAARSHLQLAEQHLDKMRSLCRATAENGPARPSPA